MTLNQRAVVHDVLVDVSCTGRFYDFLEKRDGRWAILLRQPIYERDRMDPVDSAKSVSLNSELLNKFPEGYRHLAYMQTMHGYDVKLDMPGARGAEIQKLYKRGREWLSDGASPLPPLPHKARGEQKRPPKAAPRARRKRS